MAGESARPSVVVTFPEEVDVTNSAVATADVFDALGSHSLVIVDMSGTKFCDSSGMRMLLVARNHADVTGSVLRIVIGVNSPRISRFGSGKSSGFKPEGFIPRAACSPPGRCSRPSG